MIRNCVAGVVLGILLFSLSACTPPNTDDTAGDASAEATDEKLASSDPPDPVELECLAKNVLYESGGEIEDGQHAVAHVTLNRVRHGRYPTSVCSVIKESRTVPVYKKVAVAGKKKTVKAGSKTVCQFGWWCAGRGRTTPKGSQWEKAQLVAYADLTGQSADPTQGALNFQVRSYQRRLKPGTRAGSVVIGNHVFFTE